MLPLPGHFFDMCGFRTDDGVWFLADCLTSETVIEKYHVQFLYDVAGYLETLDKVCTLEGRLFICLLYTSSCFKQAYDGEGGFYEGISSSPLREQESRPQAPLRALPPWRAPPQRALPFPSSFYCPYPQQAAHRSACLLYTSRCV